MNRTRSLAVWSFALVAGWLAICCIIGVLAVEGALHPQRMQVYATDEARAQTIASKDGATLSLVQITAPDGARLRAWFLRPASSNDDAVLLLHGQSDNRAGELSNADLLLRRGFAVLLPDARGHGESGGAIATYGALETDDLRRWADWLEGEKSPRCLFGLGDSMGAAQLLESLRKIPEFCAVVAESSFSTFREAAFDRIGQQFSTGPWLGRTLLRPAVEEGLIYARLRYRVNLAGDSPLTATRTSHVPVLLIHGLADANLPPRHSERMKAARPEIELWEPPSADHCGASSAAPQEYERRVIGWFEAHS